MKKHYLWSVYIGLALSLSVTPQTHSHVAGPVVGVEVEAQLVPNPDVPEFVGVRGRVIVNTDLGTVRLRDLKGFPDEPVPYQLTSESDPRLEDAEGNVGRTSCELQGDLAQQSSWICPVNSYVVWLGELEGGELHHPIPLATIYPNGDGTAANRSLTFRGNVSGFGSNVVLITAEETFGPMPSLHNGVLRNFPAGPVVATFTLIE